MRSTKRVTPSLVLAMLVCTAALSAAEKSAPPTKLIEDAPFKDLLVAEKKLQAAREGSPTAMASQMLASALSRVGDYEGAIAEFRKGDAKVGTVPRNDAPTAKEVIAGYEILPAIEAIVKEAKDRQVVILNEAHHISRHRAFAQILAARLREIGFEFLACETFSHQIEALAKRGHVVVSDGTYTREPLFADFVRQSLKLGFIPVAYETDGRRTKPGASSAESINQRETDQAENLVERIFKQNPKARVFIYVGYSHLLKKERPRNGAEPGQTVQWMAGRLKAKTGIDPLTIDQVAMTDPAASSPHAAVIAEVFAAKEMKTSAMVLRHLKEPRYLVLGSYQGDADIQVFHRNTRMVDGRPDWLAMEAYRRPHEIPADLLAGSGRRLIKAHFEGEDDTVIAVDQIVVSGKEKSPPVLMLPVGTFRFSADER